MVEFIEIKLNKLNDFYIKDKNHKKFLKNIKHKNLDEEKLQSFLGIIEEFEGKTLLTIDYTIQINKKIIKEYLVNYFKNVKNN